MSDSQNNAICLITPAGVVSPFAGQAGTFGSDDGSGSLARFSTPTGIATDRAGNVYVADMQNHAVRKISVAGRVTTLAGNAEVSGYVDAQGSEARFSFPLRVTVDEAGHAYLVDYDYDTVRKISSSGVVTTIAGVAVNQVRKTALEVRRACHPGEPRGGQRR